MDTKRISVRFLGDYERYNAGESAVFDAPLAYALKKRGTVEFNEHEVRNDSNMMGLLSGANGGGMSQTDIGKLIDQKLDEKLKPLFDLLDKDKSEKKDAGASEKSPLQGAVKK